MGTESDDAVRTEAEVLGMAPTAKGASQMGEAEVEYALELSVQMPDGSAEQVQHSCPVPSDKVPGFGQRIPVTVSPSDPKRLAVEWDEIGSLADAGRAAGEAAQAGDAQAAERAFDEVQEEPPS